jgi:acyl-CoA oxidase
VDNGRIWFDGVRVPRTALLNRYASIDDDGIYTSDIPNPDRRFFATIGTLVGGRIGVGAASVSVTKSALTIALRYAYRRRQFGTEPGRETLLIDYPLHQQRLIPRLAATYAYHFAFERLTADLVDEAADPRRIEARAAGLKARATRHAIDTVQEAREACGGQGFLSVNRLTEMRKDADIFTTYEGDNTVLLQLVAKGLLSDFRQQFNSLNMIGLIRQLTRHALGTVSEAAPITRSTTSDSRLLEASWQLEQLQERERHQVGSLARRLKHRIDANVDPFDAFTQVQTHAFAAAHSHVDHHVLDSFVSRINELDAGPVRDVLDRLRSLHGLATIRSDIGWFQQHGILSASTAEAIDKLQERLVADLAGQSLGLVDAFAIPDEVLAAPIAAYDRHAEVPG